MNKINSLAQNLLMMLGKKCIKHTLFTCIKTQNQTNKPIQKKPTQNQTSVIQ